MAISRQRLKHGMDHLEQLERLEQLEHMEHLEHRIIQFLNIFWHGRLYG